MEQIIQKALTNGTMIFGFTSTVNTANTFATDIDTFTILTRLSWGATIWVYSTLGITSNQRIALISLNAGTLKNPSTLTTFCIFTANRVVTCNHTRLFFIIALIIRISMHVWLAFTWKMKKKIRGNLNNPKMMKNITIRSMVHHFANTISSANSYARIHASSIRRTWQMSWTIRIKCTLSLTLSTKSGTFITNRDIIWINVAWNIWITWRWIARISSHISWRYVSALDKRIPNQVLFTTANWSMINDFTVSVNTTRFFGTNIHTFVIVTCFRFVAITIEDTFGITTLLSVTKEVLSAWTNRFSILNLSLNKFTFNKS